MSSLTSSAHFDAPLAQQSIALDRQKQALVLILVAIVSGLAIALLGLASVLAIPAVFAVVAILANPEFGLYALLLTLALPVPLHLGGVVIYGHDGAAVLTIVAAGILALRRKQLPQVSVYFLVPAMLLLLVQLLSIANSNNLQSSGIEIVQQFYLLLVIPFAWLTVLRDKKVLRRVSTAFMLLITAEALLICCQFFMLRLGSRTLIDMFAFGRSTFNSSRVFGTIGPTVGLLLVASVFLWIDRKMYWAVKVPVVLLHMFALFATGTRSALAAFFFTLIFYLLFSGKKAVGIKLMIPLMAAVMIFVSVLGVSRFAESFSHATDSRLRFPIDMKALQAVPEHPVIGHGPKAASNISISIFGAKKIGVENEFVARLYNNGALGLAVLLVFGSVPVLATVSRLRRRAACASFAAAAGAVIVGIYSAGLAGCIFEGSLGQWVILFYCFMLAAANLNRAEDQAPPAVPEAA